MSYHDCLWGGACECDVLYCEQCFDFTPIGDIYELPSEEERIDFYKEWNAYLGNYDQ